MKIESVFEKDYNEREFQMHHPELYRQINLSEVTMTEDFKIPGNFRVSVVWRYDDAADPQEPKRA